MAWFRKRKQSADESTLATAADHHDQDLRKKLVRRLDIFLMSYVCVSYCMKYIDQNSTKTAYVSGMKEDINLLGDEYNYTESCFAAGYCIGSIISQILVAQWRPSIIIPFFEAAWTVFVMGQAAAKNAQLLYGMRFMTGFFEAIAYPAFISLLASWYTPAELAKRVILLVSSSSAGSMFSGYLQSAIIAGLGTRSGLAPWQWLFVIDGIISFPIAFAGYWLIPDSPSTSRAKWLTPDLLEVAQVRMDELGRAPKAKITKAKVWALFKEYPVWIILFAYPTEMLASRTSGYMSIWLKSKPNGHKFSVYQINLIPTAGSAVSIVSGLIVAAVSDRLQKRYVVTCFTIGTGLIGTIILSVYTGGLAANFVGYMLVFAASPSAAMLLTWYSEISSADAEIRTLLIGIANGVGYAWTIGFPILMFPVTSAPKYPIGYPLAAAFYALSIILNGVLLFTIKKKGLPFQNVPKSEEVYPEIENTAEKEGSERSASPSPAHAIVK